MSAQEGSALPGGGSSSNSSSRRRVTKHELWSHFGLDASSPSATNVFRQQSEVRLRSATAATATAGPTASAAAGASLRDAHAASHDDDEELVRLPSTRIGPRPVRRQAPDLRAFFKLDDLDDTTSKSDQRGSSTSAAPRMSTPPVAGSPRGVPNPWEYFGLDDFTGNTPRKPSDASSRHHQPPSSSLAPPPASPPASKRHSAPSPRASPARGSTSSTASTSAGSPISRLLKLGGRRHSSPSSPKPTRKRLDVQHLYKHFGLDDDDDNTGAGPTSTHATPSSTSAPAPAPAPHDPWRELQQESQPGPDPSASGPSASGPSASPPKTISPSRSATTGRGSHPALSAQPQQQPSLVDIMKHFGIDTPSAPDPDPNSTGKPAAAAPPPRGSVDLWAHFGLNDDENTKPTNNPTANTTSKAKANPSANGPPHTAADALPARNRMQQHLPASTAAPQAKLGGRTLARELFPSQASSQPSSAPAPTSAPAPSSERLRQQLEIEDGPARAVSVPVDGTARSPVPTSRGPSPRPGSRSAFKPVDGPRSSSFSRTLDTAGGEGDDRPSSAPLDRTRSRLGSTAMFSLRQDDSSGTASPADTGIPANPRELLDLIDACRVDRSGVDDVQLVQAARALLILTRSRTNRLELGRMGGVRVLVHTMTERAIMHSRQTPAEQMQDSVLPVVVGVLYNLAKEDLNRVELTRHNGLAPLIRICRDSSSAQVLEVAAGTLGNMALHSEKLRETIGKSGAVEPLVHLCRISEKVAVLEMAGAALWSLACDNDANRARIVKHGGIRCTLDLLRKSSDAKVQEQAAGLLGNLTWHNEEASVDVMLQGGLETLVNICQQTRDSAVQFRAAGTIGQLATTPERVDRLLKSNALPVLLRLCETSNINEVVAMAAAALWAMSHQSPQVQAKLVDLDGVRILIKACNRCPDGEVIARISGVLGTLAETPSYRSQIVQQDGIDAIVRPCFVISSPRVLFAICRALRNFTRGRFSDTIVRCLVYLLRSSKSGRVLGAAATIIWDLAFANVDNCMRLITFGVLEPLLNLCELSRNPNVVKLVASALDGLASCPMAAERLVHAGGAKQLVYVCRTFERERVVLDAAGHALWNLSSIEALNNPVMESGAFDVFLRMAGDRGMDDLGRTLRANGVGGVRALCVNPDAIDMLIQRDGIGALVQACVMSDEPETREEVLAVLYALAESPDCAFADVAIRSGAFAACRATLEGFGAASELARECMDLLTVRQRQGGLRSGSIGSAGALRSGSVGSASALRSGSIGSAAGLGPSPAGGSRANGSGSFSGGQRSDSGLRTGSGTGSPLGRRSADATARGAGEDISGYYINMGDYQAALV